LGLSSGIIIEQVFTPEEAARIVNAAEQSPLWLPATIDAGTGERVDRAVRDADVLLEAVHPPEVMRACMRLVVATRRYADAVAADCALDEVQLVRYGSGGHYADHRDAPLDGSVSRVLSVVCFLNGEFTGGRLVFPESGQTVTPQPGTCVLFPPPLLHRAEPVYSGRKYAITAWYHDQGRRKPA
jgi:predicted 2-oxoglutarate/Fe(II)-dependent dioxygenase YbiX